MNINMKELQADMVTWRRMLHTIPEVGNHLPQTVAFVTEKLDEMGIDYELSVGGNAVIGLISGSDGPCIALRADMDALPIKEDTGLDFASTNGNMHACGHDSHVAMLLGAAKYLNTIKSELRGTVKLFFQPGEEGYFGAKKMLEEGCMDHPRVDVVFGLHAGHIGDYGREGDFTFKKGAIMASSNTFEVEIKGRGAHGAYPHMGVDPIVAAASLINSIQALRAREIEATQPCVITIGSIQGGVKENIIPESVKLTGTVRTLDLKVLDYIASRLKDICKGLELTHRVGVDLDFKDGYPPTVNDEEFTDFAYEVARDLFGNSAIYMDGAVMGAEDISFFINEARGSYAFMVNPRPTDGIIYPHHHPRFDIIEAYMERGALLLAEVARRYLANYK